MAGVFAKAKGVDDVVFFNHELKVSELLLGNVIVVKNNQWYTPDIDQGGVDGVIRAWLLDRFKNITLTPLNKSHLENADLLLGCNALRGLYRLEM
jgi:branched-subunit amino acid aminotransferase/4-amino-4-deoxychorismate lyase